MRSAHAVSLPLLRARAAVLAGVPRAAVLDLRGDRHEADRAARGHAHLPYHQEKKLPQLDDGDFLREKRKT
eukprot:CAMPEP_0181317316 /NCGR_PEP_ID=MMETSP1101-20121128/16403_1 /TAXON_ID=46948 /ORGANISM="Rhodomonas abbreviata, Strain Caron Lab Isolate" /LENGTH=70 /DNA_ID=CAMNT_0023424701 /DNA_START=188 /DNA_END=396 /DNA_ORIENTATION=+